MFGFYYNLDERVLCVIYALPAFCEPLVYFGGRLPGGPLGKVSIDLRLQCVSQRMVSHIYRRRLRYTYVRAFTRESKGLEEDFDGTLG